MSEHIVACTNHDDCDFPVFIVTVGGRINSVWARKEDAPLATWRLTGGQAR